MPAKSLSHLEVEMIGGFDVYIDGDLITSDEWSTRRSAELVQLLALGDDHRMARDQVMEALWPHLDADAAAANLRKAARHARRALRASDTLVLRRGMVTLFPDGEVTTDLEELMRLSRETIDGDPSTPYHLEEFERDRRIVLYRSAGSRSALGAQTLQEIGYSNIAHLDGGIKGWKEAGYPVEVRHEN